MTTVRVGRLEVGIDVGQLTLVGRLDDSAALGGLVGQVLSAGPVTLETSGVTFVNSVGMREWIRFLRALRERGTAVILERVADVLMTQMNLIAELQGIVQINSFHAQYVCSRCGAESAPVIDAVANAEALQAMQAPRVPCAECPGQMELADFTERYLTIFRR